ncbi:hypothetical protein GOD89_08685, partial [Sinorhizobium medicae]|nr:hypothetical protein [Sinorhizobium medicae]MDX0811459.1 hypothetical protein [Sinorhizobium medicae]
MTFACRHAGRAPSFTHCTALETSQGTAASPPSLISVLVTEIQQRRVCGAGRVFSAQGLGLAGNCVCQVVRRKVVLSLMMAFAMASN